MNETKTESSPFAGIFFRLKIFSVALVVVAVAGVFAGIFSRGANAEIRAAEGVPDARDLASSAGSGVALGTLGGFRTVLADIAWLRAFSFWESRDPVACLNYARLSMTLSPGQFFFLENAANYVAFDFPVWEISRRGGTRRVSESVRGEIHRRAMEDALALLNESAEKFPDDFRLPLLAAQIVVFKTEFLYGDPDYRRAATLYKQACKRAGAPLFAFAIYAKFVAEHIPDERANAEKFLTQCRDEASSPRLREFFSSLLDEFFSPANATPSAI